jgi:tetratricopeptide (TPR) repeat protein
MPYRASMWTIEFKWDEKVEGFFAKEPELYDPSALALDKADSAMAAGNIHVALFWYQNVFYPQSYMNEAEVGRDITKKCHEKALVFFKANQNDSAVHYMEMAFSYYPNMYYTDFKSNEDMKSQMEESPYQIIWTEDQMKLWMGDYGLFLYKAKKYQESITHNSYLNLIFPEMAGPYLQLGDSYFDSGKKSEAKNAYKKYSELKKAQKKEKDIPKRVKERSK